MDLGSVLLLTLFRGGLCPAEDPADTWIPGDFRSFGDLSTLMSNGTLKEGDTEPAIRGLTTELPWFITMEVDEDESEAKLSRELWGDALEENLSLDFTLSWDFVALCTSILVLDDLKGVLVMEADNLSAVWTFLLGVLEGDLSNCLDELPTKLLFGVTAETILFPETEAVGEFVNFMDL